ncbi:MAG: DUF1036 domain-containing protein [Synergistaceae bacterium]|jgi:uncharacterized membrane protein|nr:DUF1036 domain-containing protein [Synergistaceae bacterium]
MKRVTVLASLLLASVLVFVSISGAFAASITVSNGLGVKLSVAVAYYDRDSGSLVTNGWRHIAPGDEATITVNADETKDFFYAAYNKDQFIDSSTNDNAKINRWCSPRNFTLTGDATPSDDGAWEGKFYKVNGSSVKVDGRPRYGKK